MNLPSNNVRDYPNLTRAVNDMFAEINARSPYKERNTHQLAVPNIYYIDGDAFVAEFRYGGLAGSMSIEFGSRGRDSGLPKRKNPPMQSILRWVEKKGIRGRQKRSKIGRFKSGFYNLKQTAYAIAKHIGAVGTKPKGWGQALVPKVVAEYQVRFSQAFADDMEYQITKYYPDLAK